MVSFNVDSNNYDDFLQVAANRISAKTEEATEMFASIRDQLEDILKQIDAWESRRSEFVQREQIDDYDHPETLEDFDLASDAAVEDLYTAWDMFAQAEDLFNDDTIRISELKMYIENAINQAGVE